MEPHEAVPEVSRSKVQSATPVLLCTTKYYSSTHKVLLQYYSVLQILIQYYSVLHSASPVLLCTTKYYSVLQSTTPVLESTTPVLLCIAK